MKIIVVPIDFSTASVQALDYAIQIANRFGSAIQLINGIDDAAATSIYTDVRNMMRTVAERKLQDLIDEKQDALDNDANIQYGIIRGETVNGICDYAKDCKADLIIMGTQGASGLKEIFIGSVAQGVINSAECPVLVIPPETHTFTPVKFALTLDEQELSSQAVVQPVKDLVAAFDAKLEVFHYNKGFVMEHVDPRIDHYLHDVEFSFHEHYADETDIVKVIDQFVKSEGIDVLTMIRRKRSFWDRLFHTSVTSKEVFHSEVPVLILKEKY